MCLVRRCLTGAADPVVQRTLRDDVLDESLVDACAQRRKAA
jgi:hypothetical protein